MASGYTTKRGNSNVDLDDIFVARTSPAVGAVGYEDNGKDLSEKYEPYNPRLVTGKEAPTGYLSGGVDFSDLFMGKDQRIPYPVVSKDAALITMDSYITGSATNIFYSTVKKSVQTIATPSKNPTKWTATIIPPPGYPAPVPPFSRLTPNVQVAYCRKREKVYDYKPVKMSGVTLAGQTNVTLEYYYVEYNGDGVKGTFNNKRSSLGKVQVTFTAP